MDQYSVNIAWSDEDGGFVARVSEFPDLYAFGDTKDEALRQAETALSGYIEIYQEQGIPLPEPSRRSKYSGQLRLRMPPPLHEQLADRAAANATSLNQHIVLTLSNSFAPSYSPIPRGRSFVFVADQETVTGFSEAFQMLIGDEDVVKAPAPDVRFAGASEESVDMCLLVKH